MGKFISSIFTALSNPKVQKIVLIIVIAIVVIVIASKGSDKLRGIISRGLYGVQGDAPYASVTDNRKLEIEKMAADLYSDIYAWITTTTISNLEKLNGLNDSEFLYYNDYYNKFLTEYTLYKDIDEEWLWETDIDDDVLARLKKMNLA